MGGGGEEACEVGDCKVDGLGEGEEVVCERGGGRPFSGW